MRKITVCIPAYNEECTIERCIKSIQNQKCEIEIDEILVGVNSSTDNTKQIVYNMSLSDKRIKIIDSKKGKPISWNCMNNAAKNSTRVFIDGDCYLDENSIQNLIRDMNENIMVGGTLEYNIDNVGIFSKIIHYPKRLYPHYFDLCGALYAIDYDKLRIKMDMYGYTEMPKNLIADDRWLVLISENVNISRNSIVYTNACSISDQIKRVKRMLISDEQLKKEHSSVYINLDKFQKNKSKLKKEELYNMSFRERYIYIAILPIKILINKIIILRANSKSKLEKTYTWEKIKTSRGK